MLLPLIIWLFIPLLNVVYTFKSGAPQSMCSSMIPHHKGATPQQSSSPYKIRTSHTVTQEGQVGIKINGGPFLGILLQARKNPEVPNAVGSFLSLPNSLKTISCNNVTNSAVTHIDNDKKEELEFQWRAPPNFEDDVTFVATVVTNYSTFWTGIVSQPVHVEKYTSEINENPENGIKPSLYEECELKKDCLGYPEGCLARRTCQTVVIFRSGDVLEFEMMSLGSKYVAVGISEDMKMGGDYVVECVSEGDSVKTYESWNVPNRKENVRMQSRNNLKLQVGDFTNGNIYCLVKIASSEIQLENFVLDFNKNRYYMLLAAGKEIKKIEGSSKSSGVGYHDVGRLSSKSHLMTHKYPNKVEDPFYEGCNVDINCFGVPENCVEQQNCKYVVSVSAKGEKYTFRMKGESPAYVAVGLSHDDKMGEDSVMECVNNGRSISAYMSWNKAGTKANTREGISQAGINLISGNISDNVIFCEFTRQPVTVIEQKKFDLTKDKYVLLLASGSNLKDNGVGFHNLLQTASSERRYLSDVRSLKSADNILVRLHGALMVASWIGTASIGIVLARYFKQTWVERSLCAKDLWFAWHRFFMLITWCLTLTGCALIFVDVGGWVPAGSQKHAILGIITIILCFIQPIGAAFRPHPSARNRPIFNWLHWFIGNAAHIMSIVTIFFAVPLTKAQLPDWVDWILVAFVAFYVSVHIILSIAGCTSEKKALRKINSFQMKEMNTSRGNMNNIERKQDAPMAGFRKLILFIHIVYITGLTAALIVIIVLAPIGTQWKSLQNNFMGM